MKVAVLGASGILGQHLIISVPSGIEAVFTRRTAGVLYQTLNVIEGKWHVTSIQLQEWKPDVIINLMGENRPDKVQKEDDPDGFDWINTEVPGLLAHWCNAHGAHLIHVSSQAVLDPVNTYGFQKDLADVAAQAAENYTVIRPTFVLGIRPFPAIGRENPAERILSGRETHSVDNRYFAVSFAWDVAELLWKVAQDPAAYRGQTINAGNPERLSRYSLAKMLGANPEPVTQEWAEANWGIAPRPMDTSGAYGNAECSTVLFGGIATLQVNHKLRSIDEESRRAKEIAAFLKQEYAPTLLHLHQGFGPLHNAVTEDFREHEHGAFQTGCPDTETQLLDWYRTTESYVWELTAYHCDPGFNYAGMCKGIVDALMNRYRECPSDGTKLTKGFRVLCLGDGVGSLTIALKDGGLEPVYHDLAGSQTAAFAAARFEMRFTEPVEQLLSTDFAPPSGPMPDSLDRTFDAVVSLDFLEHVPQPEEWIRFAWKVLNVGGVFVAQNAFGMGSGPDGAMPMHLASNDHWIEDWDPYLSTVGFRQLASQWYEKPKLPAQVMQPDSVPAHRKAEWE